MAFLWRAVGVAHDILLLAAGLVIWIVMLLALVT
jgi:hypothetical protein